MSTPQRIVCLTEETTETLYLLGEQHRIVGISGFTVRPPQARKEKPKVSAFTSAKESKILELEPDLVLAFSDMQADICADLIRAGVEVHCFNQRTVEGIFQMIESLGRMLAITEKSDLLISQLRQHLEAVSTRPGREGRKPCVYFEEWPDPLISGIGWVSELIELAGGVDCAGHLATFADARSRIIEDPQRVVEWQPDIIIGSWCGRKFRPESLPERSNWGQIPAIQNSHVYEIKSPLILQPGPAALTDGVDALANIIDQWRKDDQCGD